MTVSPTVSPPMSPTVTLLPVEVPDVLGPGLDLPATLLEALASTVPPVRLVHGDIVVVASKVVSLAEHRLVDLPPDADGPDPRRPLVRGQARRIVVDHPRLLVVETHHGFVCANAGIDTSNVPAGTALLLPVDPDASAERLRTSLAVSTGADVGIVVTDTFGRPWRTGLVDVAIGTAGITPLRDERGTPDLHGRILEATVVALADEVAGAADLVRAKARPVPFVVVRGLHLAGPGSGRDLVRPAGQDLFPAGGPTMADHVVAAASDGSTGRPGPLGPDGDDPVANVVALAVDGAARDAGVTARPRRVGSDLVVAVTGTGTSASWVAVGRVVARIEVLATARGWEPDGDGHGRLVLHRPPGGDRLPSGQSSTTNRR